MLDPSDYKTIGTNITSPLRDVVTFKLEISHDNLKDINIDELMKRLEEGIEDGLNDSFDNAINKANFNLVLQKQW